MRPALLLAAGLALLFFDLGSRVLATNDDARFPLLARDLLAGGDWLLPRLNGHLYLNKPPLYAWLIALVSWPGGAVTQWSAALPSLLAALGVAGLTYWITRRLFDPAVGLMAGLIVLATHGVFTLARQPMPDMALCLTFTAAMAAFVVADFEGRPRALLAFYLLVAVAFWLKGPVGLMPIVVVLGYTLVAHGRTGAWRLLSPGGLGLLMLLIVPWWILGATAGRRQFTQEVVLVDLLGWYFPTPAGSRRSPAEPISQTLAILLPWTPLLPFALWSALRAGARDAERARRLRLFLVWGAVVLVLVGLSAQQRMRYYLPLVPAAAVLIAVWWRRLRLGRPGAIFACVWLVLAMALAGWHVRALARLNAGTDLRPIVREVGAGPVSVYVADVPELVLAFYLGRPVTGLRSGQPVEEYVRAGSDGFLIVSARLLGTAASGLPVRRVASGTVSGRAVVVLARE